MLMNKVIDNPVAPSYTTIDKEGIRFACIKIDEGEFEGTVYHYENLQVGEEDEDGEGATLNFNYHIVEPVIAEEMMVDNIKERFEDTVACILQDILIQQIGRIGNEDGTDDSAESNP
jgi:hypothetical protein